MSNASVETKKKTVRILAQAADDPAFPFVSRGTQQHLFIISWAAMDKAKDGVKTLFGERFDGKTCNAKAFQQLIGRAGIKKSGLPAIAGEGGNSLVYAVPEGLRDAIPARPDEPTAPEAAATTGNEGSVTGANSNGANSNGVNPIRSNANDGNANPPVDYQYWYYQVNNQLMQLQENHALLQADHTQLQTENHHLRRMLNSARDSLKNWVSDLTGMMCGMGIDDSDNCEEGSSDNTEQSSGEDDGDSVMDE